MFARANDDIVIEFQDVHKRLGRTPVLTGMSIQIRRGETMVIIGRSGIGKTVTLKHMVGLLPPDRGRVIVDGEDITDMEPDELERVRRKFGVLFQSGGLLNSLTVGENVALPLTEHGVFTQEDIARVLGPEAAVGEKRPRRLTEDEIARLVREKLAMVDLHYIEEKTPDQLSGGMRKRVGLARALILHPEILLYDEPTAGLDPISTGQINETILAMKEKVQNLTSIVVTHDMPSAFTVADRIAMLDEGRIVKIGRSEDFLVTEDEQVRKFVLGPYKEETTTEEMFGEPYDFDFGEFAHGG
ncbi:MAG: ATP-binding cassette domain-containing protein [Planctomycetota bacterium]